MLIDHLVYAVPNLDDAVENLAARRVAASSGPPENVRDSVFLPR